MGHYFLDILYLLKTDTAYKANSKKFTKKLCHISNKLP